MPTHDQNEVAAYALGINILKWLGIVLLLAIVFGAGWFGGIIAQAVQS